MEVSMPAHAAQETAGNALPPAGTACFCHNCATANEKAPGETGAFPSIRRES
jgi:hypothetical protein